MPAGKKRTAEEANVVSSHTKAKKVQKTSKKVAKPPLAPSDFKAKALPLHVHITHTPPSIVEVEEDKPDTADATVTTAAIICPPPHSDPGLIGSLTLIPSTFSTGSYGWKGAKRVVVELRNSAEGEEGMEKVQVMLTINATVLGSKKAKEKPGETVGERGDAETVEEGEEDDEHGTDSGEPTCG